MHPFSRIVTVLLIFLSFSLFASAQHTAHDSSNLAIRDESCGQDVLHLLAGLHAEIQTHATVLAGCNTVTEAAAEVAVIAGHVESCAAAILTVGTKLQVEASLKTEIVTKVVAIISLILHACLELSLKLGLKVVLASFSQLDLCLKLLLVNLGTCIEGIVAPIAKLVVATCADILVTLSFKLCLSVLGSSAN